MTFKDILGEIQPQNLFRPFVGLIDLFPENVKELNIRVNSLWLGGLQISLNILNRQTAAWKFFKMFEIYLKLKLKTIVKEIWLEKDRNEQIQLY